MHCCSLVLFIISCSYLSLLINAAKILVIPSPATVRWTRLVNISEALAQNGHQVTLVDLHSQIKSEMAGVDVKAGVSADDSLDARSLCERLINERKVWMDSLTSAGWDLVILSEYRNPCARLIASRSASRVLIFSDQVEKVLDRLRLGEGASEFAYGEVHMLVDHTPVLDWPLRSIPSTIVHVGGMHCPNKQHNQLLMQDNQLKAIDAAAKKGIILVDMTDSGPEQNYETFASALNNLHQYAVVWLIDQHLPKGSIHLKDHIFLVNKWESIYPLLSNPKTKLLISDGTAKKCVTSLCAQVPVVGVCFNQLQQGLIDRYLYHGLAIDAINGYTSDPQYIEATVRNALKQSAGKSAGLKQLRSILAQDMQTPLEKATFWIEFVLRHAQSQQAPAVHDSLYILLALLVFCVILVHQLRKLVRFTFNICLRCKPHAKSKTE